MTQEKLQELGNIVGIDIENITPEFIFQEHLMNIGAGVLMMLIGGFLLFRTRKLKGSGKRTAGMILIGLGFTATAIHVIQMIVG